MWSFFFFGVELSLWVRFISLLPWQWHAVLAFLYGNLGCGNGTGELGSGPGLHRPLHKQTFHSGTDILKGEYTGCTIVAREASSLVT